MRCLALVALALSACANDQQFGKNADDDGASGGPDIEVTPTELDYGALTAAEIVVQTFTVKNVGTSDSILEVSGITIGGSTTGFSIVSEETSFSLPSGTEQDVEVAFTPMGANAQVSDAVVASNDEDEPSVSVHLLGEGLVPELQIDPDPLDMGLTYIGCDKENEVTLTNVGTDLLRIETIEQVGEAIAMTNENALPLTLRPAASITLQLLFTPLDEQDYTSEITVTSNEPMGTRIAAQTGQGRYAAQYADSFEVPTDPPADILFFVDQSCSMDDDQRSLADNFADFISQLSTYTTDWHVMVANDDDGCNNSSVLTSSSADYEGRFESAVGRGGGSYTEAGLIVTSRAIEETDASECNDRFLRSTALLHIIMVSDEPEQSPGSWNTYVTQVVAKKGDASLVKFSAIAGDAPSGCSSSNNSAAYGSGYDEAVTATGGLFLSICSNWSTNVRALADASVTMQTFTLTNTPVEATIYVEVNGREQRNGWTYDASTNAIAFDDDHVRVEGDLIDVTYAGAATCD